MLREFAQIFTGAFLRSVAGVHDAGELLLGFFKDPDGGSVWQIAEDLSDIWVTVQSAMEDTPTGKIVARLFIPMNMLWNLPTEDESCMVARGADAAGPGKGYAMYGDAGKAQQVPSWLDKNNAGISSPKKVHVESSGDDVDIDATGAGKKVMLQGGGKGVARLDDTVNCGWLVFTPNVPPGGAAVLAYLPPDTQPVPTPLLYPAPAVLLPLRGKIDSASNKSESG